MCSDDTVRIPLRARDGSVRAYALVDAADADFVNQWRWCLDGVGYAVRARNIGCGKSTRKFRLHRELLGLTDVKAIDIDHISGDRLDNRRSNLRVLPKGGNAQNRPSNRDTTSQYRGVSWRSKNKKWCAQIKVRGKVTHLGLFVSEEEAAEVALAARRLHMPFATD